METKEPKPGKLQVPEGYLNEVISFDYFPKHGLDKSDLNEDEQIRIIRYQLSILNQATINDPSFLENAITFKFSLTSYPPLLTKSYENFAGQLESFQNWNRFFETLNFVVKPLLITTAIFIIVLTTIFVLMLNPVTLPLTLLLMGLATLGGYGSLIALPTFLYNDYLKPKQMEQIEKLESELESEVTKAIVNPNNSVSATQKDPLKSETGNDLGNITSPKQESKVSHHSGPLFPPAQQVENPQVNNPELNPQSGDKNNQQKLT